MKKRLPKLMITMTAQLGTLLNPQTPYANGVASPFFAIKPSKGCRMPSYLKLFTLGLAFSSPSESSEPVEDDTSALRSGYFQSSRVWIRVMSAFVAVVKFMLWITTGVCWNGDEGLGGCSWKVQIEPVAAAQEAQRNSSLSQFRAARDGDEGAALRRTVASCRTRSSHVSNLLL